MPANSGARTVGTVNERPKAAGAAPKPAAKRTCLIVDDSRMIRGLSRQILEANGYSVMEAEHGEEALARIKAKGMPSLVMLDWNMPVMTGLETLKAIRKLVGDDMPKVLFCTTNTDAIDIHKGIEAGANEWVAKPFDKATLEAKLDKIGAI